MKQVRTATRQGFPLTTLLMMVPVIAGLSNPGMINSTMHKVQSTIQSSAGGYVPAIQGYAGDFAAMNHGGGGSSMFVSGGGPIYLR